MSLDCWPRGPLVYSLAQRELWTLSVIYLSDHNQGQLGVCAHLRRDDGRDLLLCACQHINIIASPPRFQSVHTLFASNRTNKTGPRPWPNSCSRRIVTIEPGLDLNDCTVLCAHLLRQLCKRSLLHLPSGSNIAVARVHTVSLSSSLQRSVA
jgi:hypothetical protein